MRRERVLLWGVIAPQFGVAGFWLRTAPSSCGKIGRRQDAGVDRVCLDGGGSRGRAVLSRGRRSAMAFRRTT